MNHNPPNNTSTNVAAQIMDANAISEDITSMIQDAMGGLSRLLRRTRVRNNQQNDDQKSSEPDLIVNLTHLQQNAECYRVNFDQTWKTFINSIKKYLQPSPVEFSFYINTIKSSNNIPYNYHGLLSSKVRRGDIIVIVHDENIVITIQTNGNKHTLKRKFKSTDTIFDIKQRFIHETNNMLNTINLYQEPMGYAFEDDKTLKYYHIATSCTMNNIPSKSSHNNGKSQKKKKVKIDKSQFIKTSAAKKTHYSQFPTLTDYAKEAVDDKQKEVIQLTNKILSEKPSGDPADKDTLLHILNGAAKNNGKKCMFFDSSKNIKSELTENAYLNTIDGNDDESAKFVLTLSKLDGIEDGYDDDDDQKMEEDKSDKLLELKECLANNTYNPTIDEIRQKLGLAHGIDANRIVITDIYLNGVGVAYRVTDLTQTEKNKIITETKPLENKMKKLFKDYEKCAIHPALLHNTYDISMFDELGNKTFGDSENSTYKVGPPGKEREYIQPAGWTRYGLKVLGKPEYGDDKWLTPFQDPGNWYRAYHGTSREAGSSIYKTAFRSGANNAYGKGIYCTPDITIAASYCRSRRGTVKLQTKKGLKEFYFVFQCAVNPDTMNNPALIPNFDPSCEDVNYWIAPTGADIRPYGILIKEV